MQQLQTLIENAFERRADITPANVDNITREAVNQVIALLDSGELRVAEKINGEWVTHQWLKKAVLLSFRINDNKLMEGAETRFYDKVPMKFADYDEARFPARRLPCRATSKRPPRCIYRPQHRADAFLCEYRCLR
jgi:2,3,4,5-tetrahydropyridine-2,6-dicarboxylate N-succinyltransferase